jgi:hypothetical protein
MEVLEILGKPDSPPDWVDLYKVFEIVRGNAPGLYQRGWVTRRTSRPSRPQPIGRTSAVLRLGMLV